MITYNYELAQQTLEQIKRAGPNLAQSVNVSIQPWIFKFRYPLLVGDLMVGTNVGKTSFLDYNTPRSPPINDPPRAFFVGTLRAGLDFAISAVGTATTLQRRVQAVMFDTSDTSVLASFTPIDQVVEYMNPLAPTPVFPDAQWLRCEDIVFNGVRYNTTVAGGTNPTIVAGPFFVISFVGLKVSF